MIRFFRCALAVFTVTLLTGCKIDLYNDLPEQEANEMLALLMLRDISAKKQTIKGGSVSITVEKDQY